jgi:rhamnogalacturonyl hydrolase YesR
MVMGNMDDDQKLRNVAVSHADKTMENHFREDFTTFHLVDYVPETGAVNKRITVQGLADASAWARGQAWALYGYVMMYQQTADRKYLTLAQNISDMIITYLPEDGIPYWDFNDPKIPDTNRDASAGAIMASAFIVLDQVADNGKDYMSVAERQLRTLAGPEYLAEVGTNGNFLLKHSVGCLPESVEVDVPLTYADYYFLEALLRYRNANNK